LRDESIRESRGLVKPIMRFSETVPAGFCGGKQFGELGAVGGLDGATEGGETV
jgi:hypothetical protein